MPSGFRPLPPRHAVPPSLNTSAHTMMDDLHMPINQAHSSSAGVWDADRRPDYASSLTSSTCNQLLQQSIQASSAHQLDQADSSFASPRTAAGVRQKKPSSNNNSKQRPTYRSQECRPLHAQWHEAERLSPGAPSATALLAQLQDMLNARTCSSRISVNSSSPLVLLSHHCHLSHPLQQPGSPTLGTTVPLLHKQPPTCQPHTSHSRPLPSYSTHPSQLKKSASAYSASTMAGQVPFKGAHLSFSDALNPYPHQTPQLHPIW